MSEITTPISPKTRPTYVTLFLGVLGLFLLQCFFVAAEAFLNSHTKHTYDDEFARAEYFDCAGISLFLIECVFACVAMAKIQKEFEDSDKGSWIWLSLSILAVAIGFPVALMVLHDHWRDGLFELIPSLIGWPSLALVLGQLLYCCLGVIKFRRQPRFRNSEAEIRGAWSLIVAALLCVASMMVLTAWISADQLVHYIPFYIGVPLSLILPLSLVTQFVFAALGAFRLFRAKRPGAAALSALLGLFTLIAGPVAVFTSMLAGTH